MTYPTGIAPPLARALAARGYDDLTAVQSAVLDPALDGADLLVSAQTGSGKTVAFGLAVAPTLLGDDERLPAPGAPMLLAIAPTRELAMQVKRELDWLYAEAGAVTTSCVGGMDPRTERRALERGAHIVVGTPGRLRDHITRRALDTSQLRAVVLDEADEMLDLGFREDLEFILEETPLERRTLMFSATVPAQIERLAKRYQRDAKRVRTVEERSQHADIEYRVLVTAPREGGNAVLNVLRYYEAPNALVFCNTRAAVAHMAARLGNRGFKVVALSGELDQAQRTAALQSLRDGRARVCVATDVAARGIDLPNLELVIHAELPTNPETLLHRSGRTGRAGRKGISALIVEGKGRGRAERLLRFAKLQAEWTTPPTADEVAARDDERMMSDPAFTEPTHEGEADTVAKLLETFDAQQLATAYLRLVRASRSAPEDVATVSFDARAPKGEAAKRREFADSAWVSLGVGRKQNAEPRWLIPLMLNNTALGKRDIGAIRMQPTETFVEIDAERMDDFTSSIGPKRMIEKVSVKLLDGPPELGARPSREERAPREERPRRDDRSQRDDRPKRDDRPQREERPQREDKPLQAWTVRLIETADASAEAPPPRAAKPLPAKERKPFSGAKDGDPAQKRKRPTLSKEGMEAPKGPKPRKARWSSAAKAEAASARDGGAPKPKKKAKKG